VKRRIVPTSSYVHNRRVKHRYNRWLIVLAVAVPVVAYLYWQDGGIPAAIAPNAPKSVASATPVPTAKPGDVLSIVSIQSYTPVQTEALARQNYGAETPLVTVGMTKITFRYRSELPTGQLITEYARAYLPSAPARNLPIFAFAPGTTGIGDECAASLENVKVANWGDYDSHMALYAAEGYAAVTTDYEGMRDPSRIHHYMVGELEGRAVLDSIRALEKLPETQGRLATNQTFLAGYSQGGQAAFWADKIAPTYAPAIKPLGVVGFGPVMSVSDTLDDVMHGANIDWFGPYVLYSYADYYKTPFPLSQILTPVFAANLNTAVPAHCINTDISYWGSKPANVYTPEFMSEMNSGNLVDFPTLQAEMNENAVGADPTPSAKLINSGSDDNVVLPSQQETAAKTLCASSKGPVQLKIWPKATHYDTMIVSLDDTLTWMKDLRDGVPVGTTCGEVPAVASPAPTPAPTPQASLSVTP